MPLNKEAHQTHEKQEVDKQSFEGIHIFRSQNCLGKDSPESTQK